MKCLACDRILTDREATRKSVNTDEFIDLCDDCFDTIKEDITTIDDETTTDTFDELADYNDD